MWEYPLAFFLSSFASSTSCCGGAPHELLDCPQRLSLFPFFSLSAGAPGLHPRFLALPCAHGCAEMLIRFLERGLSLLLKGLNAFAAYCYTNAVWLPPLAHVRWTLCGCRGTEDTFSPPEKTTRADCGTSAQVSETSPCVAYTHSQNLLHEQQRHNAHSCLVRRHTIPTGNGPPCCVFSAPSSARFGAPRSLQQSSPSQSLLTTPHTNSAPYFRASFPTQGG